MTKATEHTHTTIEFVHTQIRMNIMLMLDVQIVFYNEIRFFFPNQE